MSVDEQVFTNARLVLRDEVVQGTLVVRDGLIAEIDLAPAAKGEGLDGDLLMPGLVELHTDHLEKHATPRPGVSWNPMSAVMAHDAQLCGAGITTVLDAVRIGDREHEGDRTDDVMAIVREITECGKRDVLRAEHLLHIRCEISAPGVVELFEAIAGNPLIRLVSLMDHTPGQRQFTSLEQWRKYYGGKNNKSRQELDDLMRHMQANAEVHSDPQRRAVASICRELGYATASHDDATEDHVSEAVELGLTISEFPTTHEAAAAAKREGMTVIAGSPNVVRGGSHSGNVAAAELARSGHLDALSSDYVPISLLHSAFMLPERAGLDLVDAVRKITATPAEMVGLHDRGELAVGKRADLIQVNDSFDSPVVRRVWREGSRVA